MVDSIGVWIGLGDSTARCDDGNFSVVFSISGMVVIQKSQTLRLACLANAKSLDYKTRVRSRQTARSLSGRFAEMSSASLFDSHPKLTLRLK